MQPRKNFFWNHYIDNFFLIWGALWIRTASRLKSYFDLQSYIKYGRKYKYICSCEAIWIFVFVLMSDTERWFQFKNEGKYFQRAIFQMHLCFFTFKNLDGIFTLMFFSLGMIPFDWSINFTLKCISLTDNSSNLPKNVCIYLIFLS